MGVILLKWLFSKHRMNFGALPKFQAHEPGEQSVSVAVEGDSVVIRLATWEPGLGWCVQKTMRLDAGAVADVSDLLSAARIRLAAKHSADVPPDENRVIEFPSCPVS